MALNDIKVPRENAQGTFDEITLPDATTSARGLLSASDKTKLDSVASGAEVNVQSNWTEADTGSDAFILNKPSTFNPSSHSSSHHTGGTDAIAPSSIGAQTLFTTTTLNLNSNTTLTAARATNYSVINSGNYTITLPTTGHLVGDIVVIRYTAGTGTLNVTWGASGQSIAPNAQYRFIATGTGATNWALVNVDTHTHTFGTTAGTFTEGNDARLSDSRSPTAHKNSHAVGQSDALAPSDIGAQSIFVTEDLGTITANVTLTAARAKIYTVTVNTFDTPAPYVELPTTNILAGDVVQIRFTSNTGRTLSIRRDGAGFTSMTSGTRRTFIAASTAANSWADAGVDTHTHAASDITSGTIDIARLPTGAGSTQVALGNHTHELTALAATGATNGHVLTANGSNGATFAALPASGVSSVASSASDVLGVSGSDITGVDANADRIVYWSNTANKLAYGTPADAGAAAASHTHAASDVTSGTFDNARINFAAPAAIGGTTPSTGAFTSLSTAPAANTAAFTTTGYSLTGSNAQSLVDLAGTWNTTGTPSAIKLNVTDTASNASSLLMQLQTGGTNRFTVSKGGAVVCASVNVGSGAFSVQSGDFISNAFPVIRHAGTEVIALTANSNIGVNIRGNLSLGFNANSNPTGIDPDLRLWRDGADTLAQYRGTNAQEKRLYGTFTSATNYQRMTIKSVKQTLSALSGASATTTGTFIPDGAVVVGVTTRVATALTGAAGYTIGDGTDADRWGDITGTAIGTTSDNRDWTAGTIECFTAGGEITLTAKTSNFSAGAIEICVFYLAGQAD